MHIADAERYQAELIRFLYTRMAAIEWGGTTQWTTSQNDTVFHSRTTGWMTVGENERLAAPLSVRYSVGQSIAYLSLTGDGSTMLIRTYHLLNGSWQVYAPVIDDAGWLPLVRG